MQDRSTLSGPRRARRSIACVVIALLAALSVLLPANASADDDLARAFYRAHGFLSQRGMGYELLKYIHFGADFHGHALQNASLLDDQGNFTLVYRFRWEKDGLTDVAFDCDRWGNVSGARIAWTNAEGNPPFLWANVSIQVLGNLALRTLGDSLSPAQRKQARWLVDHADAQGLMLLWLQAMQALKG